ncbi:MAG TPA: hypothetical protein VL096_15630 [Pirellulaceae bacterium]|nr:hypothetical protein [Pirellulaceae bacterium]
MAYWLARHPPGYLSRHSAQNAQPIELAEEIQALGAAFADWVCRPGDERWDTFALQAFSAHLFSTFRSYDPQMPRVDRMLLELTWPPGSERICHCLRELQQLLAPPLAVFRAVRAPLAPQLYPTPAEFRLAESFLATAHSELLRLLADLADALRTYSAPQAIALPACAELRK